MPDATEATNGDSTEALAATPPPAEVDDDDDLLDGDDPDLEGFDVDAPDEFPLALPDDALPDDSAIDHILSDIPDDLAERLARLEEAGAGGGEAPAPAAPGDEMAERLNRLEQAAQALADAELKRATPAGCAARCRRRASARSWPRRSRSCCSSRARSSSRRS